MTYSVLSGMLNPAQSINQSILLSLMTRAGSGEYCALDLFVDFGAIYIVCLFTLYAYLPILFSSPFSLSFPLRIDCSISRLEVVRGDQSWFFLVVMVALCNRADHYIFILWFLLSFFFFLPRLISAVGDWMSTVLPHMVWP